MDVTNLIWETRMIQSPSRKTIFDCNNNYYNDYIIFVCVCVRYNLPQSVKIKTIRKRRG